MCVVVNITMVMLLRGYLRFFFILDGYYLLNVINLLKPNGKYMHQLLL
jgi:hypothetical protein